MKADARPRQVVRHEVIGGLLDYEPWLDSDIAFGGEAIVLLENRLGDRMLNAWLKGDSALRERLAAEREAPHPPGGPDP